MFYYDTLDFALAGCVYNLEKLALTTTESLPSASIVYIILVSSSNGWGGFVTKRLVIR